MIRPFLTYLRCHKF